MSKLVRNFSSKGQLIEVRVWDVKCKKDPICNVVINTIRDRDWTFRQSTFHNRQSVILTKLRLECHHHSVILLMRVTVYYCEYDERLVVRWLQVRPGQIFRNGGTDQEASAFLSPQPDVRGYQRISPHYWDRNPSSPPPSTTHPVTAGSRRRKENPKDRRRRNVRDAPRLSGRPAEVFGKCDPDLEYLEQVPAGNVWCVIITFRYWLRTSSWRCCNTVINY